MQPATARASPAKAKRTTRNFIARIVPKPRRRDQKSTDDDQRRRPWALIASEFHSPVRCPRLFVVALHRRAVEAISNRIQVFGRNAEIGEVFLH